MTVAELIEWLKTQDQGAVVEVISAHLASAGSRRSYISQEPFNVEGHSEYCDLRGNTWVKAGDPRENTRTLLLGSV